MNIIFLILVILITQLAVSKCNNLQKYSNMLAKLNSNSSEPGGTEMETCFRSSAGFEVDFPEMRLKAVKLISKNLNPQY